MEISRLNNYYNTYTSSKTVRTKDNSDTEINREELFKNEVLGWKEKMKKKLDEDLQNDQQKNIMMSEKQWHALMKKVDSAINAYKEDVRTEAKAACELNGEDKHDNNDSSLKILNTEEEIQLSAKDFMSLASDERLHNIEEK
ncbi:MAG: hypothetical protein AB9836_10980 [Aminipila sp.]